MSSSGKRKVNHQLYNAILSMNTLEECISFFEDLCTVTELVAMEQRFQVAQLLDKGLIYNDILEQTGASSATISRVNRCLQYGADGYRKALDNLNQNPEAQE